MILKIRSSPQQQHRHLGTCWKCGFSHQPPETLRMGPTSPRFSKCLADSGSSPSLIIVFMGSLIGSIRLETELLVFLHFLSGPYQLLSYELFKWVNERAHLIFVLTFKGGIIFNFTGKNWSFGILVAAGLVQWICKFSLWRKFQRCRRFRYKTSSWFHWYLRDTVRKRWRCPDWNERAFFPPYASVWLHYSGCSWGYPSEHCAKRASIVHMSVHMCLYTFCMHAYFYIKLPGSLVLWKKWKC